MLSCGTRSDIYQGNLNMIDVCVCTHNPRAEIFQVILQAIANQTIGREAYQVWVIDNASNPPISSADLAVLTTAGIKHQTIDDRLCLVKIKLCESQQLRLVCYI